ncbi:MAG TPA: hypothetical protein VNZ52_09065 [Candidatus Thermoplasmatota archaeon]|nr:hypothetical protein [Candidatus Thermoplasmatota archaeon]
MNQSSRATRFKAVALAFAFLLPAFSFLATPAAAAVVLPPTGPTADVKGPWEALFGTHKVYFKGLDTDSDPADQFPIDVHYLGLGRPTVDEAANPANPGHKMETYGGTDRPEALFVSPALTHEITLVKSTLPEISFYVGRPAPTDIESGLYWEVDIDAQKDGDPSMLEIVKDYRIQAANATNVAGSLSRSLLHAKLPLPKAEVVVPVDYRIRVHLTARYGTDSVIGGAAQAPTWTLFYESQQAPSNLQFTAKDFVYAAPWFLDSANKLPSDNTFARKDNNAENRLSAWIAVKSAFGTTPTARGGEDRTTNNFEILATAKDPKGNAVDMNISDPNHPSAVPLKPTNTNAEAQGLSVWQLPVFKYEHLSVGTYKWDYSVKLKRGGDNLVLPVSTTFSISSTAFTFGLVSGDSAGHAIFNGTTGVKSTTYLLSLKNGGATADAFTLSTKWNTRAWDVSGELAQQNVQFSLRPGETRRIPVTVTAPGDGKVGDVSSLTITARSLLDPTEQTVTLATTLVANQQRGVELITDKTREVLTTIGGTSYDVLVWNKGNDHDSFILNLTAGGATGFDYTPKGDVRVTDVPPGQVAVVTVSVTTPPTAERTDRTFRLTAIATSLGGLADVRSPTKLLDTVLRGVSKFDLQVFDPSSEKMQTTASATVLRGCFPDNEALPGSTYASYSTKDNNKNDWWNVTCGTGTADTAALYQGSGGKPPGVSGDYELDQRAPDWVQFRLWVTNTGTLKTDYLLRIASFQESGSPEITDVFPPTFFRPQASPFPDTREPSNERADFGHYRPVVSPSGISYQWKSLTTTTVGGVSGYEVKDLAPGERAEVYVKVRQTDSVYFLGRTLSMAVEAIDKSNTTVKNAVQVSLKGVYQAKGSDKESDPQVRTFEFHAEPLRPLANYDEARKIATDETNQKTVLPGQSVEFSYRVSNLHNWVTGWYNWTTSNNVVRQEFNNRSLNLTLIGQFPEGWKVEMRNETQNTTDSAKFDWKTAMNLIPPSFQVRGARNTPYVPMVTNWEHQIRIRVTAPANAKVNVDSIAPTLVVKALEKLGEPQYYYLKVDVRSNEGVAFTAPKEVTVRAGTPSSYPLTIENTGAKSATVLIQPVVPATLPWSVTLPQAILTIGPGDRRVVTATVDIPQTETGDGSIRYRVCAFTGQDKCQTDEKKDLASASIRHLILDRDIASRLPMDASVLVKPIAIQNGRSEPQNFTFKVKNLYNERLTVSFDVFPNASDPTINKNFTLSVVPSTLTSLKPQEEAEVQFVVQALGATSGSSYPFTVRAFAKGQSGLSITGNNRPVNLLTFTTTTLEGSAVPSLDTLEPVKSVDRAGFVRFPIFVKNVGSLEGEFPLEVPQSNLPTGWRATLEDEQGRQGITLVKVGPGAAKKVFLNVSAPADAERAASVTATLIAYTAAKTAVGRAERSVTAEIHEYAFSLQMPKDKLWIEPGGSGSIKFRVKNEGNGWDNLTFIAALPNRDNRTWERRVELDNRPLTLKPGEEKEVTISFVPPTTERGGEWVQPGDRTVTVYGWSLDALRTQRVLNVSQRGNFDVAVYNFKHDDVDGDDIEELAIDLDRNPANGFEVFREWNPASTRSRVVETFFAEGDGKTTFILDTNRRSSGEGEGDTYWNPSLGILSAVQFVFDSGNGRPVYLFDRTGPEGGEEEVDSAFFTGEDPEFAIRKAREVSIVRTDGREFLIYDVEDDLVPVLYFNAGDDESSFADDVVTEVAQAPDSRSSTLYGIRTDPKKAEYTHYFDTKAETVQDATNKGVNDFLRDYWYFIAGFVLVVVVAAVVVVKRSRGGREE